MSLHHCITASSSLLRCHCGGGYPIKFSRSGVTCNRHFVISRFAHLCTLLTLACDVDSTPNDDRSLDRSAKLASDVTGSTNEAGTDEEWGDVETPSETLFSPQAEQRQTTTARFLTPLRKAASTPLHIADSHIHLV